MSYRKSIKVLCVVLSIIPLNELFSSVTIYTPEGRPVTAHNFTGDPYYTNEWAQYWIDYWPLDAEIIGNPTKDYNCHGYAWAKTENIGNYWIQSDNELKFTSDGSYANDSQPSYISCSESVATHAYYEPYSDHSIRVIQNGYPVSSSGSQTHVSKWNDGPLVRHAPRNDYYAALYEYYEEEPVPIQYFKLKTTHYGTLSNYPKTWVGAGGQTHTLSGNTTLPNNTLTIKSGATVNLSSYYLKSTGGTITRQSSVSVMPKDISVIISGNSIKGQFQTIADAFNNCSSGQTVDVTGGIHDYSGNLVVDSGKIFAVNGGATIRFSSSAMLQIYSTLIAEGTPSSHIKFTKSGSSYWYGIKFEDSSNDASCIVKYADIEYAALGVYCWYASPTIEYCNITNSSYYGVYAYNSYPKIKNNTISNATRGIYSRFGQGQIYDNTISECDYGIYLYKCDPTIQGNTISYGSYGVYLYYSDTPNIRTNLIEHVTRGIYLHGGGWNPWIDDNRIVGDNWEGPLGSMIHGIQFYYSNNSYVTDNTVTGCATTGGIYADHSSYSGGSARDGQNRIILTGECDFTGTLYNTFSNVDLGKDIFERGRNAIYIDPPEESRTAGVLAFDYSIVWVIRNWWGKAPPSGFISHGGSEIFYDFWLTSDPGGGSSLDKTTSSSSDILALLDSPPDMNSAESLYLWGEHYRRKGQNGRNTQRMWVF